MIDGENVAAKDLAATGLHVRRRDEQLEAVGCAQAFEIDRLFKMDAQRIDVERIELIGAQQRRSRLRPGVDPSGSGPEAAPGRQRLVDPSALEWRERALGRDQEPELFELLASALPSPLLEAGGEHDGVHRAGARAADRGNLDPRVLGQRVEHAPGVGAVRAAALQGQIDDLYSTGVCGRLRRGGLARGRCGGAAHAAVHPPSIERLAPVICAAASEHR